MTTRRQFLARVAAVGGFSAAYASLRALDMSGEAGSGAPLVLPRAPQGTRVVILGAGIAGLVSAYELNKAGYQVTILEARERVGGRNWTIRRGTHIAMTDGSSQHCAFAEGQYFNAGPARLPSHHRTVLAYCKQFGIMLETEVNQSRSAFMHAPAVHGGQPFRIRQAMSDTRGHVTELLSKAINRGRLDDQLSSEDRERMVAFLTLYGDLNSNGEYRGSPRAGYKITPGAFDRVGVPVDPLSMHELLDADLWLAIMFDEFVEWQATMLQPIGGMDRIPHAFAERLDGVIKLGQEVQALQSGEHSVKINYKDVGDGTLASLEADYVIATLPLNIMAGINSNLSSEVQTALRRVKYDHSLKVAFEAPRFWEEQQIYGGISYVKNDCGLIWYPSHGFQSPTGILLGAYANGDAAQRLGDLPLAARIAAASASIEQVHAGCSQWLSNGVNVTWHKVPYSLGPWVRPWEGGGENDPQDFKRLNQADGRVYFATANLSQIPGWQEGAMLSAHRVLQMISARAANGAPA